MGIDEELENIDLTDRSEMEGVAEQIFRPGDERTNLNSLEIGHIMACDIIFPTLGLSHMNPTKNFKNLSKSRSGWATEKMVEATSGIQNQRGGNSAMERIGNLFKPRR